ncbi:CBS domain-containing protein, partial [Alicyclobacillus sp.]|uniref:CBS domain-containing protein n=1 Tax=Alicyclobacillus sp. TaxID=61169 RepID=UPI0025C5811D
MDEAFSALDPLIRDEMQNELLGLQSQLRKTIVFITHDLNEALKLGDRIALMRDGSIVQVGTPEQFVSHPADEYVARFVKGIDLTKVLVAADVMKRPSPLIRLKEGPGVALRRLRDAGVSSGFVVDEQGRLAGLVTADQLAGAVRAQVGSIAGIELEHPLLAAPDTPLEQLVRDIVNTRYPLAVVDSGRRLRGIVLKSSILEALASRGGDEDVAEDPAR